jgi:hypothetical protein
MNENRLDYAIPWFKTILEFTLLPEVVIKDLVHLARLVSVPSAKHSIVKWIWKLPTSNEFSFMVESTRISLLVRSP